MHIFGLNYNLWDSMYRDSQGSSDVYVRNHDGEILTVAMVSRNKNAIFILKVINPLDISLHRLMRDAIGEVQDSGVAVPYTVVGHEDPHKSTTMHTE